MPVTFPCSHLRKVGGLTTHDVEDGWDIALRCLAKPLDGVGKAPAHARLTLLIEDAEKHAWGQ